MTKTSPIRELTLGALIDILENDQYSHQVIQNTLKKYQYLEKQDRAFFSRLTEGTVEQLIRIDYVLNQYSKVKVKKMKPVIRNILRMGVYQILFMNSVPDSAACNEAVNLAKKKGFANLKGFVNGNLRNISRNKDTISYPSEEKEPTQYLSVYYSMPEWIIQEWLLEYEYTQVKGMLEAFLEDKPISIRCNLFKTNPIQLKELLEEQEIVVQDSPYLPYAYLLSNYNYLNQIKEFAEGYFQVQDISSMFAVQVADIKKADTVLDVCAAPGGKSLHAADCLGETGVVISRDVSDYKVSLIQENIQRLGYKNITTEVHDALTLDADMIHKADVVLADLPCSGLGVIGKKADIKYKMTAEKQKELVSLQREILSVIYQYVKPGGTLIYSTCTINRAENLDNVQWFMQEYNFALESIDAYIPDNLKSITTKDGYLQFLPGIHKSDGFFVARLQNLVTE